MSNNPFDWRKNDWAPGMGRGGFVPKSIQKLSHKERVKICKKLGHPVEAIEPFTWEIDGIRIPGHICIRCFGRVKLDRLIEP